MKTNDVIVPKCCGNCRSWKPREPTHDLAPCEAQNEWTETRRDFCCGLHNYTDETKPTRPKIARRR